MQNARHVIISSTINYAMNDIFIKNCARNLKDAMIVVGFIFNKNPN